MTVVTSVLGHRLRRTKVPGGTSPVSVAVRAAEALRERGVVVGCFRPPSVPDGISRLRLTARADLAQEQVQQAAGLVAGMVAAVAPGKVAAR